MTKEVAYRTILRRINKDRIRKLDRYVNNVKYKRFHKMKEGYMVIGYHPDTTVLIERKPNNCKN
jgi:hypothetical protein